MGFFNRHKKTDQQNETKAEPPETFDPAPWLGRVGDGQTIESGARIARELRELRELGRRRAVDTDANVSGDPEIPIPNPDADRRDR